ncbi:hypothetical protein BSIN_4568 [Burkholderia singularis]|uniref:Uncharacterized protein n=1 Tax=Burkholderia singularis TaxID=1503053 RepID=A0A238HC51_9BURK|nr:hypothetical protein BSIN_4568 [Burkholderia singularis]
MVARKNPVQPTNYDKRLRKYDTRGGAGQMRPASDMLLLRAAAKS